MHGSVQTNRSLQSAKNRDNIGRHMAAAEGGSKATQGVVRIDISIKDRVKSYFSPSRIVEQLHEIPLSTVEREWIKVTGSLSEPLTAYNINQFLTFVLTDHDHAITTFNCKEFCDIFKKKLDAQVRINFSDLAIVLRDVHVELDASFLMIGSALSPQSSVHHVWTMLIRAVCLYHWLLVPIRVAFLPYPTFTDKTALSTDLPTDILVALHVIVSLNTAYRAQGRSSWVTTRFQIFRESDFLLHLGALPLDWLGHFSGFSNETCCWLRVNKLFLYFSRSSPRDLIFSRGETDKGKLSNLLLIMFFCLHMLSCIWYWLGRAWGHMHEGPSVSWLFADADFEHMTYDRHEHFAMKPFSSTAQRYLLSIYWVAATITVNGQVGAMIPQNTAELLFTTVIMALNMTLYRCSSALQWVLQCVLQCFKVALGISILGRCDMRDTLYMGCLGV